MQARYLSILLLLLVPQLSFALPVYDNQCTAAGGDEAIGWHASYTYIGYEFTADHDFTVASSTFHLSIQNTPTDDLWSYVYEMSGTSLGTMLSVSNNSFNSSDFTEGVYEHKTYIYPDTTIASGTSYAVVVARSGGVDLTNQFRFAYNCGSLPGGFSVWHDTKSRNFHSNSDLSFSLHETDPEPEPEPEPTIDLASTTEAIYAVGYATQIYLGIIIMLIFGVVGFRFTKLYI